MNKLNRNLSPLGILSLALGCIIGWGAFVMPATTFLPKAGPLGSAIALLISALIMAVIALNYAFMINRFPVSGGAFKYTKEVFGDMNAFICAWFIGLSYLTIIPLNATALALLGQNLFGDFFKFGLNYSVAGYNIYLGDLLISSIAVILFGFLSLKGVKVSGSLQNLIVFVLIVSIFSLLLVALFKSNFEIQGFSPLFSPGFEPFYGILAIISISPWAFLGFDAIPQAAEEFNFSVAKSKWLLIFSIFFGAFIYIALTIITVLSVPENYVDWSGYINDLESLSGLISLPTFYASYRLMGDLGLFMMTLAVLAGIFSGLMGFYMATSRLFYSIAKEGFLPHSMSYLHPSYKTPFNAILFVMATSFFFPFLGRKALLWIVEMSSIGATIGFFYTSLTALKISLKEKRFFIVVTGLLGAIFSLFFMFILLIPIYDSVNLSKESYILLFFWILLGVIFYFKQIKY